MVSLNQFAPTAMAGDMVYAPNRPSLAVKVASTESTALKPGIVVKLADETSDIPVVTAAAVTDIPYGIVLRNERQTQFPANTVCIVARDSDVIWMSTAGVVAGGAKLQFTVAGLVDDTTDAANKYIGKALSAAASGALVPVEVCCTASMQ